jgi:hypothetical protein
MNDNIVSLPNGDFYVYENIKANKQLESYAGKFVFHNNEIHYCERERLSDMNGWIECVLIDYFGYISGNYHEYPRSKKYCKLIDSYVHNKLLRTMKEDSDYLRSQHDNYIKNITNALIKEHNTDV